MTMIRQFELDQFDLLWKDLFNHTSHFSDITQKITHPTDIYETKEGIRFEIAAVGLDKEDVEILTEGDTLRIKYEKPKQIDQESAIYRGIKRSGFDLSWKVASKFDLSKVEAKLEKRLLILDVPYSESKQPKQVKIK